VAELTPDDLEDVQGVILRGYRSLRRARHLVLRIDRPQAFKALLVELATESEDGLFVTVAADWTDKPPAGRKPDSCINIGLTAPGLVRLGLPEEDLATFPAEFRAGAVAQAGQVGDTGVNDPARWIEPLRPERHDDVHAILSLFARDEVAMSLASSDVLALVGRDGAARVLLSWDTGALTEELHASGVVHFGYRDGLSQPSIAGAPLAGIPDPLELVPPGDFVLGHPSQRPGYTYPVPAPEALGRNGSFAAFRIAEQDVDAFERFLTDGSDGTEHGRELLAARLCGRWRNGVPLVMSPDSDALSVDAARLNMFDYANDDPDPSGDAHARADPRGELCPLASHIRRANPRLGRVAGNGGQKRRMVRRGAPFGEPFAPAHPEHAATRGLAGLFICVSLSDQFEFVMRKWINDGRFAGLGQTKDPLVGNNDPSGSFPLAGAPAVDGLSAFVTTLGAAYVFLPSITGLRHLGALPAS